MLLTRFVPLPHAVTKPKEEKIEEMRDEFLKEDANNDGTVSLDELKKYRQKVEGDTYDEATVEVRDALSP